MYDEIINHEEFKKWDKEKQKSAFKFWKSKYNTKEIADGMDVKEWKVYEIGSKLGVSAQRVVTKPKGNYEKREKDNDSTITALNVVNNAPVSTEQVISLKDLKGILQEFTNINSQHKKSEMIENSFTFNFNGIYDSGVILERVQKLLIMLEGEPNLFNINLSIMEVQNNIE